jgi:hypothetical protein
MDPGKEKTHLRLSLPEPSVNGAIIFLAPADSWAELAYFLSSAGATPLHGKLTKSHQLYPGL